MTTKEETKQTPQDILNIINEKIKKRDVFKYKRECLVKCLIIATYNAMKIAFLKLGINKTNQVVQQYRAILKFIYSVDNVNGEIPLNQNLLISSLEKMIMEFVETYTPVRNYLEQCGLKNREFRIEGNYIVEDSYNNSSDYARSLDKFKKFPSEDLKVEVTQKIGRYLAVQNYKSNILKDRYYKSLMSEYIQICWYDSEIHFDYDFKDFKYEELVRFCAAFKLIADYYTIMIYRKGINPVSAASLASCIAYLSDLEVDKVNMFLDYETYNFDYQNRKLTLLQDLCKFENNFYFCPISISLGLLPVKLFRVISDFNKKKYEKDFSEIAHLKEQQMTSDIKEKLSKYASLKIVVNQKLTENKVPIAEYDFLGFDEEDKTLYIGEFKWFFVADGEKEHNDLDSKLNKAVSDRKNKNKYIFDDPNKFGKDVFGVNKVEKVKEFLICQNYCGHVKQEITVIDYETLQYCSEFYDSFSDLMNCILSGEYIKSIPLENFPMDIELEGYKFNFFGIYYRNV